MKFLAILFIYSSYLSYAETKTTQLMIKGRVPASTTIEWHGSDEEKDPKIKFKGYRVNPKVEIKRQKNSRQVIIFHP